MNIAVVGCGKMGWMIEAVCARREDVQIAGFVGRGGCASLDELEEMDAALDFSHPDNLNGLLESAARRKIPLVIGTTGFSDAQGEAIREAGRSIPIVWADNFSVGVTALGRLAAEAARMLGGGFDMEIVETHPDVEVVYPVHLSPVVRECAFPILGGHDRIHLIDPVDVEEMHNLISRCYMVMTDSGG